MYLIQDLLNKIRTEKSYSHVKYLLSYSINHPIIPTIAFSPSIHIQLHHKPAPHMSQSKYEHFYYIYLGNDVSPYSPFPRMNGSLVMIGQIHH